MTETVLRRIKLRGSLRRRVKSSIMNQSEVVARQLFDESLHRILFVAFVELLEEGVNIPAWLQFNSKDGVNVVSGDSLAECPEIAKSFKKLLLYESTICLLDLLEARGLVRGFKLSCYNRITGCLAKQPIAVTEIRATNYRVKDEKKVEEGRTLNVGDAEIAIAHGKRLIQSGPRASDIGIITAFLHR
ncbi:selenocysteine Se-methyltransferase [Artemisia annua]|uniref:Selenocysteine Se-methyltransferase n=1 Tax=Artemisia annua TaxID=35608 RepID=A0A2U1L5E7_ARTAN|nr:selenocysteine Se-methyltransferase [Artemisia annua]